MTNPLGIPRATPDLFPRAYLLSIYTAAIEQGFVWINNLREADAPSLKAKLLRLRRRSDKANKTFITPDHYLVTFSDWQPDGLGEGLGRMAAMFTALPPELGTLPSLTLSDGSPLPEPGADLHSQVAEAIFPLESAPGFTPPLPEPGNIDDFVARMIENSKGKP